jgi:hypothetical protein
MLAQVSNGDGKQVVFSSMPAEADRQRDQLRGVIKLALRLVHQRLGLQKLRVLRGFVRGRAVDPHRL